MTVTTVDARPEAVHVSLPMKHVAAAVIGNALSFYDFVSYSFFSIQIGHAFFPSKDASTSLLLSLGAFAVSFIGRPIGSIVIGMMGDRVGRRPAMVLSFSLLGIGIVGISLTPSYAVLGAAAPVLAIAFRLIQGFGLGGEVGPTTAFLLEAAPVARRGLYTSLQYTTQDFAVLCAGVVGVSLAHVLSPSFFDAFGWRIAFLIGAAIVPFGLAIRRKLPETLHAPAQQSPDSQQSHLWIAFLGFTMLASGTIGTYVLNYMTTYANDTLGLPVSVTFWATVVIGGIGVVFDTLGGWLSDKIGRKPVMISCWALLLLSTLPAYYVMSHWPSPATLLCATAVLCVLASLAGAPVIIAITEALPRKVRSGALAMTYAFAISIFGGSAQPIVKGLLVLTHDPLAPAWYMSGALVVGLFGMMAMRETAPSRMRR